MNGEGVHDFFIEWEAGYPRVIEGYDFGHFWDSVIDLSKFWCFLRHNFAIPKRLSLL